MPRRSVVEGSHAVGMSPADVVLDLGPVGPSSELERVYRRSHARLTGIAMVLLGTPRGAEGLVHDAFARVLSSDDPRPDGEVVGAVTHQLVLLSRARDRRHGVPPGVPRSASRAARRCRGPIVASVDAVLLEQVQGLAPCEREVLALCTVGGLSPADAAAITGSTRRSVDSDLARAVRVLVHPAAGAVAGPSPSTAVDRLRQLARTSGPRPAEPDHDDWEKLVGEAARLRRQRWRTTASAAGAAAMAAVIILGGTALGGPNGASPTLSPRPVDPGAGQDARSPAVVLDDEDVAMASIVAAFDTFAERDDSGFPNLDGGEDVAFYDPILRVAADAFGNVGLLRMHVQEIQFLSDWQAQVDVLVHVPDGSGAAEVPLRAYAARVRDRWVVTHHTLRQLVALITEEDPS